MKPFETFDNLDGKETNDKKNISISIYAVYVVNLYLAVGIT